MQNLNPHKYNTPRSYNANCYQDRMGFAMRDEQTTMSTSVAGVINPLGTSIAGKLIPAQTGDVSTYFHYDVNEALRIPGVMSFDFEPVFAPQSGDRKQIVEDIFNNWWSVYRLYYNGADKIQPADIAIRCMAQMLIDVYVQYIRRALTIMKTSYSANNNYVRNTVLLHATGLRAPVGTDNWDFYIRSHYTDWVNYFNDSILGSLNACKWIGGIFPGEHRWSSLVTELYKDESIDSDYVQLYAFKPRSFYSFATEEVEPGIYAWKLVREDWPIDFETLLQKVHDFIRAVYYDSSALDIQAMLQTISVRGKSNETMIYDLAYDQYPLEGEQLKFTYDWAMLMAIHNMTIMYGLRAFDVSQDPATGRVTQEFQFDTSLWSYRWFETPKITNLPNFAATQSDLINAAQWQIAGSSEDLLPGASINPAVLGTDVIVDANIHNYDQANHVVYDIPVYQFYRTSKVTLPNTSGATAEAMTASQLTALAMATQFNLHPIGYLGLSDDLSVEPAETRRVINGFLAPLDVVYRITPLELASMKESFVHNFWGYPIRLKASGSFELSKANTIDQSDAGIGAGAAKSSR